MSSEIVNNVDTASISLASELAPIEMNGAIHTSESLFQTFCRLRYQLQLLHIWKVFCPTITVSKLTFLKKWKLKHWRTTERSVCTPLGSSSWPAREGVSHTLRNSLLVLSVFLNCTCTVISEICSTYKYISLRTRKNLGDNRRLQKLNRRAPFYWLLSHHCPSMHI